MIKVILIDDHPMVTNGLHYVFNTTNNIEVTAVYNSANSLLVNIANLQANVIMLDMQLPDGNGYHIATEILKVYPHMGILIFSSTDVANEVKKMLQLGCHGYLLKNASNSHIIEAVKAVAKGLRFISPELERAFLDEMFENGKEQKKITLSNREKEVLILIAKGYTNQEIASHIFLSLSTIEFHRANMLEKLGVKNTAGLVKAALQLELV